MKKKTKKFSNPKLSEISAQPPALGPA